MVDRIDDRIAKHRSVNWPEFDQEAVDPLQTFRVGFEPGLCHLAMHVISEVTANASEGGSVVGSAKSKDDEDPS